MALNWRGQQLAKRVERASINGINATMSLAIKDAKEGHAGPSAARDTEGIPGKVSPRRFQSHTGELERSVRITQQAKRDNKGVFGRWGSQGIIYARRIEMGFQGPDAAGRNFDQPAFPFLRPATKEYDKLAGLIRKDLRRTARA